MPLSEHEQRLLEQIEQALYAEDPKFASAVRSARPRSRARSMLALAVVGVVLGLALVLVGLVKIFIPLAVVGFVLIVGSCLVAVGALRGPKQSGPMMMTGRPNDSRPGSKPGGLRNKMEDRMRRRFDDN
ncbi:MAG: hypothetical protein QOH56_3341 [Pseudonocardiales bacterium]|nr:hypothetical protein [Pseudonocardiales bacterium]